MQKTYLELLKDPRWQKKRLEILELSGFACRVCSDDESELHIHHLEYRRGAMPWEYTSDDLIAVCKPCHEFLEGLIKDVRRLSKFEPDACAFRDAIELISSGNGYELCMALLELKKKLIPHTVPTFHNHT